jgi:hypothetical protein
MAYENKDLIIYDRAYHLCLWVYPATSNYPRFLRGLAIRTTELATQLLLDITKANAERSKTVTVSGIVLAVRQLKTLLRLAMELKGLSFNQYEHAAKLTDEIGKLAWGWLRATYDDRAQHNFFLDQLEKIKDQDHSSGSAVATGTTRRTLAAGPRTATTRPATPTATSDSAAAPVRSLLAPETGAA